MQSTTPIILDSDEERLVSVMSLLGDKTRYKIFKILQSSRELCVSEIASSLDVSVPAVSQHFKIFELTGIVDKIRNGQRICYQLKSDDPLVKKLISK